MPYYFPISRKVVCVSRRQEIGSSNQITLEGQRSRTEQSELFLRSIFPYRPITFFGRTILRNIFPYRTIRSFGRTFLRTIFPYRPIRSFVQTFLWTIFPYRPIRSFGRTFLQTIFQYQPIISLGASSAEISKRSSHSNGHGPHELKGARSPSLNPTRHSNDLRSHEREGWNLKKKSPLAKVVLSRTH